MKRRTFDTLMSTAGVVVTVVLLVGGALLLVGYNFANGNVHKQLSQQKIFFPTSDNPGLKDPRVGPFLKQYAGQQLVSGAQAEAYANHYIAVHISDIGKGTYYEGKTYAEMGALQRAHPDDTALTAARDTVFKGETLRGLLLQAYAFWKIGQIALIAAIAAFAGAAVMTFLTALGFLHAHRVPVEKEILAPKATMSPAAV
jgi:hypothetical protein